ncbi:hypothetical protein D3C73_1259190 [compost metagenome]
MPTARPSIRASMGEMELMSITLVSANVPPTPTATPISAMTRGSPAAMRVPSMRTRTRAATATPTISATPKISETSSVISLLA